MQLWHQEARLVTSLKDRKSRGKRARKRTINYRNNLNNYCHSCEWHLQCNPSHFSPQRRPLHNFACNHGAHNVPSRCRINPLRLHSDGDSIRKSQTERPSSTIWSCPTRGFSDYGTRDFHWGWNNKHGRDKNVGRLLVAPLHNLDKRLNRFDTLFGAKMVWGRISERSVHSSFITNVQQPSHQPQN